MPAKRRIIEDEESDEEEELVQQKKTAPKASQKKSTSQTTKSTSQKKKPESDNESDEEQYEVSSDEETKKKKPVKKAPPKKTPPSSQTTKASQSSQSKSTTNASITTPKEVDTMEIEDTRSSQKADEESQPLNLAEEFLLDESPRGSQAASSQAPFAPRSRLMIPRIVLENFKSYAGKQEVGPFHKCFSSVVGPNGSGKSNVIDAMLFVFGKRAKQLRHNKVSELIHRSEKFPHLGFCKVSVYFQEIIDKEYDENEYEVVPGSEFVVTRYGYENNTSKYTINEKSAKWEEVSQLLRKKGIDLDHNRFLILQGEVEQIAMMKPKAATPHDEGMLEYLEDIIGTTEYVPLIKEKEQELENADHERNEKLNRVKLSEKEKDNLESSKDEAEEYLTKENEIIINKCVLFQLYRNDADETAAANIREKTKFEEKLAAEREKARESTEKYSELEDQYKKEKKEYERVEKQMKQAKEDFSVYERKDIKYREDIKHLKTKDKKLTESIAKEKKNIREKAATVKRHHDDIARFEEEIVTLTKSLEKEEKILDSIYASLKDETAPLQAELEVKQNALIPYRQEINEQQSIVDLKRSKLEILIEKVETGKRKYQEVTEKLEETRASIPRMEGELKEMRKNLKKQQDEQHNALKEHGQVVKDESTFLERVRVLRAKFEESKNSVQTVSNTNRTLKGLMDAVSQKKLAGVSGRLGDLGTIAPKYDVAISTACSALNHIVVDTASNAEKCVSYLRKNQLGVATFIILEKLQRAEEGANRPFKAPASNALRLFDLVKPKNDKYIPAFYFALQDTLVMDNIDEATKIAYGKTRYRVVTLEGQLIEISGAMSGGGNRVQSGGMKAAFAPSISPEEMAAMEQELSEKNQELVELRSRKQELDLRMEELQKSVKQLEIDIHKTEMGIQSAKTQEKELKARLPELKEEAKIDPEAERKVKEKQQKLEAKFKELEKAKKKSARLEEEANEIQQRIMSIGGVRLQVQKSKVEGLSDQLDTMRSNITKANVQIKTLEKQVKKGEASIEQSETELAEIKENLEKVRDESKKAEEEAAKVIGAYKEAEALLAEKAEGIKEVQKELESSKKIADKFRSVEVDLQNQLEDLNRALKESQQTAQLWSKRMSDLVKQKERTKVDENEADEELPVFTAEQLSEYDEQELKSTIASLEEGLAKMKPNMNAIREYRKKEREFLERQKELDDATANRDTVRRDYDLLRKKRLDEFMAGFSEITMRLKEMYQMITLGGDAELELVDSLDPFSEGIVFSVRPPKKSWKNISNLSGGEKTLSSLALVFALHHYKPTPLYVMDEIDAALDFKNVSIVANYIKERTKNAQFIIISLRNYMFELANHLVGIYKTENCTKSVTINPHAFAIQKPVTSEKENDASQANSQASKRSQSVR